MDKKYKVVWLCHFDNEEVHQALQLNTRLYEFAPWITIALKTIENNHYFNLYVVAPRYDIKSVRRIEIRGVNYIFYNPHIKWNYHILHNRFFDIDYITNFYEHKRIVNDLVNSINPDIVHLFGAENPYYSSTILPIADKYPTILTVQGFCSHSKQRLTGYQKQRSQIELEIIKKMYVAFYETKKQGSDIKRINPDIELFYHTYGSYRIENPPICKEKKYDIVFFARICKDKGILDLLEAIKIIKIRKPDVSLCVIGSGDVDEFKRYAEKLDIDNNIVWAGFQPTRDDVYRLAVQGKLCVLPTYHDIIPGTIMESMFLRIPVVAYATDSIPEINETGEVIKLVPTGDVLSLANMIYLVLSKGESSDSLTEKAYIRAIEMFDPSSLYLQDCLDAGYKRSIEIFQERKYNMNI